VREPHLPVIIVTRRKVTNFPQALIDDGKASVGYHEFHCVDFIPTSVNLIMDINALSSTTDASDILQSFYKGVYVCVLMHVFYSQHYVHDNFYPNSCVLFLGTANVTLKDPVFQASSSLRHISELIRRVMNTQYAQEDPTEMFIFTDGSPDHNCKHLSAQATLFLLVFIGGIDTMVELRTAPRHKLDKPCIPRHVCTKSRAEGLLSCTDKDGYKL
jgi:hypothetical protein